MVIDLTAQLAPIGPALTVALAVAVLGILACVDECEVPELIHRYRATRAALGSSLRRVLNAGRLQSAHRS